MKRIAAALPILACLLCTQVARAQHQVEVRAIINVPGMQAALLQTDRDVWLVHTGDRFEDRQKANAHFQIEALSVDLTNEVVITRVAGEEHTNTLAAAARPESARSWIHLQDATFKDVVSLYGMYSHRVLLVHPTVSGAPFSCEATWTNAAPSDAEIAASFAQWFSQRDASALEDGDVFLQIIPTVLVPKASLGAKDLPDGTKIEHGVVDFEGLAADEVVDIYGKLLKRQRKGNEQATGRIFLNTTQPLSKAQLTYAIETLLTWNGNKITLNDDGTFSVASIR